LTHAVKRTQGGVLPKDRTWGASDSETPGNAPKKGIRKVISQQPEDEESRTGVHSGCERGTFPILRAQGMVEKKGKEPVKVRDSVVIKGEGSFREGGGEKKSGCAEGKEMDVTWKRFERFNGAVLPSAEWVGSVPGEKKGHHQKKTTGSGFTMGFSQRRKNAETTRNCDRHVGREKCRPVRS